MSKLIRDIIVFVIFFILEGTYAIAQNPELVLADSIHRASISAMQQNNLDKAIELEEKACSLYTKAKRNKFVQVSISALASYHFRRGLAGDIDKAVQYNQKALDMVGKRSKDYARIANQLIMCYAQSGNTQKAKELSKNIFQKGLKAFGESSIEYAKILWNQAALMQKLDDVNQAIEYANEALTCFREAGDSTSIEYGRLLIHDASFYTNLEKYEESIVLLKKAREILKVAEGESGSNYIRATGDLSSVYGKTGNLEESGNLAMSNLTAIKSSTESATKQKAYSLAKQSEVYANSGNYRQAVAILSGAVDIFRQHGDSIGVGRIIYQLSNYYTHLDSIQKAKSMCEYSIKLFQENNGPYDDLGLACNTLSIINHSLKNDSIALELSQKALSYFESANDTSNTFYASILTTAAINYSSLKDYNSAIEHALRAVQKQKQLLGDGHPHMVMSLFNLACFYSKKKDTANASKYYHEALTLQTSFVKHNFSHLTTNGREIYWNANKYLYPYASAFAYDDQSNKEALCDAYETTLFTKGILLNSEIDFKELLHNTSNKKLIEKYNKLLELNAQIEQLYNAATYDSTSKAKKIQLDASILEREIMRECKEFGDFTDNMTIQLDAISKSLGDEDVAMELVDVESENGMRVFLAIYLRKGWDSPRMVYLFNSNELKSFETEDRSFFQMLNTAAGQNYIYNNVEIGNMVWKPIINKWKWEETEGLAPVKNIYMSPSSIFYQWGIEYLTFQDNAENAECISDRYNIYRVSSTKILTKTTPPAQFKNAVLFGSIDYNLEIEGMTVMHDAILEELAIADYDEMPEETNEEDEKTERTGSNQGFKLLPSTLKETSDIEYVLSANNVNVKSYTSINATEEALKGLDGKAPTILHVATHGFSYPEHSTSRKKLAHLLNGKSWTSSETENVLNYSGLIFAGANNRWVHAAELPDSIEDGILTSKEIAQLNLSGLDLVVLSACQTGLGDIKDDGVFGLQRAFKKAGAHTMLVSLWKVNDHATQIMMSEFYSALMEGLSLHNALSKAQGKLRANGFTDPHYWASFILIDGV